MNAPKNYSTKRHLSFKCCLFLRSGFSRRGRWPLGDHHQRNRRDIRRDGYEEVPDGDRSPLHTLRDRNRHTADSTDFLRCYFRHSSPVRVFFITGDKDLKNSFDTQGMSRIAYSRADYLERGDRELPRLPLDNP